MTPDGEFTIADLDFDPPQLPDHQLEALASELCGISGKFERLPGERDQNARIHAVDGREFVLKVSGANEDPAVVDCLNSAIATWRIHLPSSSRTSRSSSTTCASSCSSITKR